MAVHKDERVQGKLELSTLACNHALYVIKITRNKKHFSEEYSDIAASLTQMSMSIFHHIWAANAIPVENQMTYNIRAKHQELAITTCTTLLADITLSRRLFHLSSKRVTYWKGLVVEIRNKARAWKRSDAKRYAKYSKA